MKGENISKASFSSEELKKSDYVFFIEKEEVSKYKDIDKEIQLVTEAGKRMAGIAVVL